MQVRLSQIFFEKKGKLSLKRIYGSILMTVGLLGKIMLCIYGLTNIVHHFVHIDSSLDVLIWGGAGLSLGTVLDKFFLRKR